MVGQIAVQNELQVDGSCVVDQFLSSCYQIKHEVLANKRRTNKQIDELVTYESLQEGKLISLDVRI